MPFLIFILIFANLASWSIISDFYQQKPRVSFLDIGQGNSVLIANPKTISLYDSGPNGFKTVQEINKFLPFYKKRIDMLILSHPDKDHYQGSFEILQKFNVALIVISALRSEESGWLELLDLAKFKKIPIIKLGATDTITTPYENFLILNPPKNLFSKDNENSIVIQFLQQKKNFLLAGDIDKKTEEYLARQYNLKSNYLLISHHGSKYSSSEKFLKAVSPSLSIIQVGRNNYGHPHNQTLQQLKKLGLEYWRTDLKSSLTIY